MTTQTETTEHSGDQSRPPEQTSTDAQQEQSRPDQNDTQQPAASQDPPAKPETDWKAEARKHEQRNKEALAEAEKLRKELDEARQGSQRAQELEQQIATRDHELLRYKAAVRAGVPHLADRLRGETEEELVEDAKSLIGGMANPLAGGVTQGSSGPQQPSVEDVAARMRKAR